MSMTTGSDGAFREVVAISEGLQAGETPVVSRERVLGWMKSDDIEALGALYHLLMGGQRKPEVDPPLQFEDFHRFLLGYYERCMVENPKSRWADSRYTAGWDLVNWLSSVWAEGRKEVFAEWKAWLERVYRAGDSEVRECLVNATLEHLFERRKLAKAFDDWKNDPLLGEALSSAMEWSANDGRSPLGATNRSRKKTGR
jgi:hypothetical protein